MDTTIIKLIIQGDDWGYKAEISRGIEYAYENGVLTQATAIVNTLDPKKINEYKFQIEKLRNKTQFKKPKLGIGVHLNLTCGRPMSPKWPQTEFARPFKGSGKPEEWMGSAWREYFSQFTIEQVEDEYRKQLEFALNIFGEVTHIDSHQMISSYEPMMQVYEQLAREYDLPVRPLAPLSENSVYGGDFVIDQTLNNKLRKKGVKMADMNIFKLFFNERDPVESFLAELQKIRGGQIIEVMFHPARGENIDEWRKKDLNLLTDSRIFDFIKQNNIQLITYKEL